MTELGCKALGAYVFCASSRRSGNNYAVGAKRLGRGSLNPTPEEATMVVSAPEGNHSTDAFNDLSQTGEAMPPMKAARPAAKKYSIHSTLDDIKAIKWEGLGAFAGITALGVNSWDWGSSGFHTNIGCWFGKGVGSGGSDIFGLTFARYALPNAYCGAYVS